MIAYLVTLSPELSDQRRTQLDCYMPRSRITSRVLSLKSLSEDPAIRLLVEKGDMQGLYNDEAYPLSGRPGRACRPVPIGRGPGSGLRHRYPPACARRE